MVKVLRTQKILLEEKDYSKEKVISIIEELYTDRVRLGEIAQNAGALAITDTAQRICHEMIAVYQAKKRA